MVNFPELETNRLSLTSLEKEDAPTIFALFSDESVIRFYDLEAFTDISQAVGIIEAFQSRFAKSSGIRWAIRFKESGKLLGTCGYNAWSKTMKNAVIGYDLMPSYWNNGFATEAVSRIVDAAFSGELPCGPLHRIQADTIPGNLASERLLSKLGFQEEGLRRDCAYWKGQFQSLKCFGLLKHEFKEIIII